jgi:hypothetical protein
MESRPGEEGHRDGFFCSGEKVCENLVDDAEVVDAGAYGEASA